MNGPGSIFATFCHICIPNPCPLSLTTGRKEDKERRRTLPHWPHCLIQSQAARSPRLSQERQHLSKRQPQARLTISDALTLLTQDEPKLCAPRA